MPGEHPLALTLGLYIGVHSSLATGFLFLSPASLFIRLGDLFIFISLFLKV